MAATDLRGRALHVRSGDSELRTQVSVIDIKRAYFNARPDDENPTYVELPPEDPDKERGGCGRLQVHMYGLELQVRAGTPSARTTSWMRWASPKGEHLRACSITQAAAWTPQSMGTTSPPRGPSEISIGFAPSSRKI